VPALVYRHRKPLISLTALPEEVKASEAILRTADGYNIVRWNENGMTYWAISDLGAADLRKFVQLFRSAHTRRFLRASSVPAAAAMHEQNEKPACYRHILLEMKELVTVAPNLVWNTTAVTTQKAASIRAAARVWYPSKTARAQPASIAMAAGSSSPCTPKASMYLTAAA